MEGLPLSLYGNAKVAKEKAEKSKKQLVLNEKKRVSRKILNDPTLKE